MYKTQDVGCMKIDKFCSHYNEEVFNEPEACDTEDDELEPVDDNNTVDGD
jgi:hypothetical protein